MKFKKIPHPWWHWFFTSLDGYASGLFGPAFMNYKCTKCKQNYICYEDTINTYDCKEIK